MSMKIRNNYVKNTSQADKFESNPVSPMLLVEINNSLIGLMSNWLACLESVSQHSLPIFYPVTVFATLNLKTAEIPKPKVCIF